MATGLRLAQKTGDSGFDTFWAMYPKRPGNSKAKTLKNWSTRLKEGYTAEQILDGAAAYRKYCEAKKIEPDYIKRSETFLGPDKHFLSDWKIPYKASFADKLTGKGQDDFDGYTIDV